jgi:hypothetical protein
VTSPKKHEQIISFVLNFFLICKTYKMQYKNGRKSQLDCEVARGRTDRVCTIESESNGNITSRCEADPKIQTKKEREREREKDRTKRSRTSDKDIDEAFD